MFRKETTSFDPRLKSQKNVHGAGALQMLDSTMANINGAVVFGCILPRRPNVHRSREGHNSNFTEIVEIVVAAFSGEVIIANFA